MSDISDGYGDDLTNAEVVANFRRWSYSVAHTMTPPAHLDVDDLAQESMISMWRALEKKGGKTHVSATYLTQVGRYSMLKVIEGAPLTGGDSTPGPKYRPATTSVDWTSAAAGGDDDYGFGRLLEAVDLIDGLDWAYHHGEIMQCLSGLSEVDRAYVHSRFWQGKTDTEIAADRGVSNKMLGSGWAKRIRPTLTRHLGHLVGVR